jgi:hypothetical protein
MKPTEPDELVDVPVEEIERLSLVQKDQITARDESAKVSLIHKKETIRLKLLFGAGSHWTMIYDLDERPIGCEFHKVRFRCQGDRIFVYGEEKP